MRRAEGNLMTFTRQIHLPPLMARSDLPSKLTCSDYTGMGLYGYTVSSACRKNENWSRSSYSIQYSLFYIAQNHNLQICLGGLYNLSRDHTSWKTPKKNKKTLTGKKGEKAGLFYLTSSETIHKCVCLCVCVFVCCKMLLVVELQRVPLTDVRFIAVNSGEIGLPKWHVISIRHILFSFLLFFCTSSESGSKKVQNATEPIWIWRKLTVRLQIATNSNLYCVLSRSATSSHTDASGSLGVTL